MGGEGIKSNFGFVEMALRIGGRVCSKLSRPQGVTSASGRMSAVRLREMESKAGGSIVAGHGVKHGGRVM